MTTEDVGIWLGFQLAAEVVERRLGLSWGAAQKTLIEACEDGEVRTRSNYSGQGSDVWDIDFWQWLNQQLTKRKPPQKTQKRGKVPLIIEHLKEMFPVDKYPGGVPDAAFYTRKRLKRELAERDKTLTFHDDTLTAAIAEFNATRNSQK